MSNRRMSGGKSISFGDNNDATPADERPLLRSFPNPSGYGLHHVTGKDDDIPPATQVKQYLTANVSTRWADLVFVVCFFVSGLIDAGAYNAYENFASMQVRLFTYLRTAWTNKFTRRVTQSSLRWESQTSLLERLDSPGPSLSVPYSATYWAHLQQLLFIGHSGSGKDGSYHAPSACRQSLF
jgi:hypothetical protein